MALVTHADHGRYGERTHCDRIGHRRPAQHAKQSRSKNADLGWPACITPGHAGGNVQKQLTQTHPRGQNTKQHKVKNIGCHHTHCHAINTLAGEVLVVDHLAPAGPCVLEQARKQRPRQSVDRESHGNDGQRPSHRAAGCLQQRDKQQRAKKNVRRIGISDAKGQVTEHKGDVKHAGCTGDGQQPVVPRHATRVQRAVTGVGGGRLGVACKHQKDEAQHKSHMNAPVRCFLQQTKAGGVVVKAGQQNQQPAHQLGGRGNHRPEPHFGVKFLFQLLELFGIGQAGVGHGADRRRVAVKIKTGG